MQPSSTTALVTLETGASHNEAIERLVAAYSCGSTDQGSSLQASLASTLLRPRRRLKSAGIIAHAISERQAAARRGGHTSARGDSIW
jgi:hypothetical protein